MGQSFSLCKNGLFLVLKSVSQLFLLKGPLHLFSDCEFLLLYQEKASFAAECPSAIAVLSSPSLFYILRI